jgi:hypothetical protein
MFLKPGRMAYTKTFLYFRSTRNEKGFISQWFTFTQDVDGSGREAVPQPTISLLPLVATRPSSVARNRHQIRAEYPLSPFFNFSSCVGLFVRYNFTASA